MSPSESRMVLGPIVGGVLSGIIVVILALAGILWYRFKKCSTKGKPQPTASPLAELPPESALSKTRMSLTTYDPPGYTEKNAYFGINLAPTLHD